MGDVPRQLGKRRLRAFEAKAALAKQAALAWLASTAYAATDELHQMFVEDRGPALADVAIDGSGALAGILFMAALLLLRLRWRAAKHSQDDRPL